MRLALLAILAVLAAGSSAGQTKRARKPSAPASKSTTAPAPAPAEGAPFPIETLKVQGNQNYTAAQVIAVSGLKVGQPAGKVEFDAARDRLAATGAFDRVGYRYAPAADGKGYDATLEVEEMAQMYPVHFEDLPATDEQLRTWLKEKDPLFGPKIPATKLDLDRYVKLISEFLASKGYHEPIIGRVVSEHPPDLNILFRPAKPRPTIARVKFTNTGVLPAGTLQTAMHGVAIGVSYTEAQYRVLLDTTVRPLYEALGMIRVSFPKVETEPAKDVDGLIVTTQVEPGPVYKLRRTAFQGGGTGQDWNKLASLKENQPVNFDDVKAAQDRIAQSLRRSGYLQAASQVKRDLNDAEKTVDLTFVITPGPQFKMGKLDIVGLDLESEPVIRKMWGLAPGRPFNVEYPDHFLDRVKQDGVFDNLKTTRAETKINADRSVDVALYFNK